MLTAAQRDEAEKYFPRVKKEVKIFCWKFRNMLGLVHRDDIESAMIDGLLRAVQTESPSETHVVASMWNAAKDYFRKERCQNDNVGGIRPNETYEHRPFEFAELRDEIGKLSVDEQKVLSLWMDGHSFVEISKKLSLEYHKVREVYHKAIAHLRSVYYG